MAFLPASQKGNITAMPPRRIRQKEIQKSNAPIFKKNQHQWMPSTCWAVSSTTNPASLSHQNNTTPDNDKQHWQYNSMPLIVPSSGTDLSSLHTHDDSHIHRASPIQGLPPETAKSNWIVLTQTEQKPMLQTMLSPINKTIDRMSTARHVTFQEESSIDGSARPGKLVNAGVTALPPPDTNLGPDEVMQAIDEWLANHDRSQLAKQQPHTTKLATAELAMATVPGRAANICINQESSVSNLLPLCMMGSMAANDPLRSNNDASPLNATSKTHRPPEEPKRQIAANLRAELILDGWENPLQATGNYIQRGRPAG